MRPPMEAPCNYQQMLRSSLGQFHQYKVNGESQILSVREIEV